jgi:hypothetical protein
VNKSAKVVLERVAKMRNVVCHTPLVPSRQSKGFEFAPAAASKILKSLRIDQNKNYTLDRVSLKQIEEIIPVAERALAGGEAILENFGRVRTALVAKA